MPLHTSKSSSPSDETDVVSIHDSAIAADEMVQEQLVGYMLHLHLGWLVLSEEPTRFTIGPIRDVAAARRLEKDALRKVRQDGLHWSNDANEAGLHEAYFRAGVRAIANYVVDGERKDWRFREHKGRWQMPDDIADLFPLEIQREIGAYVRRLTKGSVDVRPPAEGEFDAPEPEEVDPPDEEAVVPEPRAPEPATDVPKS